MRKVEMTMMMKIKSYPANFPLVLKWMRMNFPWKQINATNSCYIQNKSIREMKQSFLKKLLINQSYKSWGVVVSGSLCIPKGLQNWVSLHNLVLQGHLCICVGTFQTYSIGTEGTEGPNGTGHFHLYNTWAEHFVDFFLQFRPIS